jgi:hypothetical protein
LNGQSRKGRQEILFGFLCELSGLGVTTLKRGQHAQC